MLQTSVDFWYISLSVSVLLLSGFLAYIFYRVARLLTDFSDTVGQVNHKLEMTDETVNLANDSLRVLNDSIRHLAQVVDSLLNVLDGAGEEVKKFVGLVASVTSMAGSVANILKDTKKK